MDCLYYQRAEQKLIRELEAWFEATGQYLFCLCLSLEYIVSVAIIRVFSRLASLDKSYG